MFANMNLNLEIFDGSKEHLNMLLSLFLGDDSQLSNKRFVLAVDPAGVTPSVIVHKDGKVDGLLNTNSFISEMDATKIRTSFEKLHAFTIKHNKDIIKDYFVVYLCPLESSEKRFPILLYTKK